MSLLELRNVEAWYADRPALLDVTLTIEDGELAAVVGANGAGKTTLLRAISRSVAVSGEIQFDGETVTRRSPGAMARLGVAHVPQGRATFAPLSVQDNLRLGAWVRRGPLDNAYARVYEILPFLYARRHSSAGALPAGEQRLLALACAVMARPRLLLIDEPSAGVPPPVVDELFTALGVLHELGTTIVVAEQRPALALGSARRAVVLDAGRVAFDGPVDAARAHPSTAPLLSL